MIDAEFVARLDTARRAAHTAAFPILPGVPATDDEWVAQLPAAVAVCAERWGLTVAAPLLAVSSGTCTRAPPAAATPRSSSSPRPRRTGSRGRRSPPVRRDDPPLDFAPLAEAADRHPVRKLATAGDATETLEPLIEAARAATRSLASSASRTVLLHGDVMDKNLLLDHGRVLAIDPMPSVGDAHSDPGFWAAMRTPRSTSKRGHPDSRIYSAAIPSGRAGGQRSTPLGRRARRGGATRASCASGCARPVQPSCWAADRRRPLDRVVAGREPAGKIPAARRV